MMTSCRGCGLLTCIEGVSRRDFKVDSMARQVSTRQQQLHLGVGKLDPGSIVAGALR